MHRSGTTLLSKILQDAGVFMGRRLEKNQESLFFLRFNGWMLKQAHCSWDNVANYKYVSKEFHKRLADIYKRYQGSITSIRYLGFKNYLRVGKVNNLDCHWGWKDPRNSITLNFWKKIYPKAQFLHIYRNPMDVALSLKKRAMQSQIDYESDATARLKERLLFGEVGYSNSYRVIDIKEGYKLWKDYVTPCVSEDGVYQIKYEELVSSPFAVLQEMFHHIGIGVGPGGIESISNQIDASRGFAFLENEEACDYYNKIKGEALLGQLGYSQIL